MDRMYKVFTIIFTARLGKLRLLQAVKVLTYTKAMLRIEGKRIRKMVKRTIQASGETIMEPLKRTLNYPMALPFH